LDAEQLVLFLREEIAVGAMTEGDPDAIALLHEPSGGDSLADVSLSSRIRLS
jgi:hypothetical protein